MFKGILDSLTEFKKELFFLNRAFNFSIIEESSSGLGFFIVYQNEFRKVAVSYDYRDNFFYFVIIKGPHTKYPNDADKINVRTTMDLVMKYSIPGINQKDLQPNENGYQEALKLNAKIIKEYGANILLGREWF